MQINHLHLRNENRIMHNDLMRTGSHKRTQRHAHGYHQQYELSPTHYLRRDSVELLPDELRCEPEDDDVEPEERDGVDVRDVLVVRPVLSVERMDVRDVPEVLTREVIVVLGCVVVVLELVVELPESLEEPEELDVLAAPEERVELEVLDELDEPDVLVEPDLAELDELEEPDVLADPDLAELDESVVVERDEPDEPVVVERDELSDAV